MYGTIARMQAKPGTEDRLRDHFREYESVQVPGFVASFVYRSDGNPNEYYLTVIFEDKESYWANARSPEQDTRFRRLMQLLEREPEWHDGEIVDYQIERTLQQGSTTRPGIQSQQSQRTSGQPGMS